MTEVDALDPVRPRWRGVIHRWAAVVSLPLFAVLSVRARPVGDRVAVGVYAVGVITMLGVSAIYHSGRLGPVATRRAKRLDHATILLAIAGSYTAVATVALDGAPARTLLVAVWVSAAVGIAIRMVWLDAPYPLTAVVYVTVGWIALIELGALADALSRTTLVAIVAGGVLYTLGGVVYAIHRPNPWPRIFGYHEVFHALVVAGAAVHLGAVAAMIETTR